MSDSTQKAFSRSIARSIAAGVLVFALAGASQAQDVGFRGPSYAGANSFPSAAKSQSKLWWNDGSWWGCLWSASSQSFTIQRLDAAHETWIDTGTAVDFRAQSHADCLWDGAKLYIASNQYTAGPGNAGHPLEVFRYGYDPNADVYALDVGFPVEIGDSSCEALVIDEDSGGTLWAVWVAGARVWFTHTLADDRSWSVPARHPALSADLSGDDICSVVRFQGDRIGVLWSDQVSDSFRFTYHRTGDPDTLWAPVETVIAGLWVADDHISLKASADGRVFAALKTTANQILLAVRSAAGSWSGALVAAASDGWTRPIVLLDEQHRVVHVFATSPVILGAIYEKSSSMDALAFGPGIGTPVLKDASGPALNDATSTKQSLDGTTGLVVLASDQLTREYWHHHEVLGGPVPAPPKAQFAAGTPQGFEPMKVQFLDASSGPPTSWSWSFGDAATATVQHPLHTYASAGHYTVSLQVRNSLGTDTLTRANLIDVEVQPDSMVLRPVADALVHHDAPAANYGAVPFLRVRDAADGYRSYLKFFVPPSSSLIRSAALRLFCTDGSPDGGTLFRVGNDWDEPTITWNRSPEIGDSLLGALGGVLADTTVEHDLSAFVSASGTLSVGIQNASTNSAYYSSREGTVSPELVLGLAQAPPGPPAAGFEALRTTGKAPFMVQCVDTSNGLVSSWSWDFGDGARSTLQNPSHAYARAGLYTIRLTSANPNGADTLIRPGYVRVFAATKELPSAPPSLWLHTVSALRAGSTGPLPRGAGGLVGSPLATLPVLESTVLTADGGARALRLTLVIPGSLEDALESFEERLPEAGIEVLVSSLACDPRSGASAFELHPSWAVRPGQLLLWPGPARRVAAALVLPFD